MLNGNKTNHLYASIEYKIPKRKRSVENRNPFFVARKNKVDFSVKTEIFEEWKAHTHHHQCRNINWTGSVFVERKVGKSAPVQMLIFNSHTMILVIQTKHDIGVFSSSFDCTSTLSSVVEDSTCTFDCAALTGIINDDPKNVYHADGERSTKRQPEWKISFADFSTWNVQGCGLIKSVRIITDN